MDSVRASQEVGWSQRNHKGSVSPRHCDHATHKVERLNRTGANELGGVVVNEELPLLPEASRSEMESGALQLSLVALGDADPLEWRRPLSASCTALTLSKSLDTHLFLSFSPKFPLSHLYPIPEKTTLAAMSSRGSSQVRVTHELGGNNIYMHIVYG